MYRIGDLQDWGAQVCLERLSKAAPLSYPETAPKKLEHEDG
jgi:hypothetical protein